MVEYLRLQGRVKPLRSARQKLAGMMLPLAVALIGVPSAGALERSGKEVVEASCAKCHASEAAGAPGIGNKAAWTPRLSKGLDSLVHIAIQGHGGMPPRGGKADLTDSELRSAVLYMFNPAGPPKYTPKETGKSTRSRAEPHQATVGGMDVYFGLQPAARMRAFPEGSPERKLHGGVPSGSGYYHVNVSLFDASTQEQMTAATVELDVQQVGMERRTEKLETMSLRGGVSYGAYVRLRPKNPYVFVVRTKAPDGGREVEARFQEKPQ